MKLSIIGMVIIGIALGTLRGLAGELATMPDGALSDPTYWRDTIETTLRSLGDVSDRAIDFVAGGLGIMWWQGRKSDAPPG